jgi:NAD(P)-dependent dehydrogenase (short-subunit alcohol dehydrogenase family)
MRGASLFDLSGKVVVVTGGSSGLGLGFARGVARHGADVVIWARSAERNALARRELEAFGGRVASREVDVSDEAAVVAGFEAVMADFGRVDCVFANAGGSSPAPSVLDLSAAQYHALLAASQHGAFYTLREGARHMVARAKAGEPGGSLVACGSLSIYLGLVGGAHYAAAKAAVAAITRSMAVEFAPFGVRANILAAGYFKTELTAGMANLAAIEDAVRASTPVARLGHPADIEGIAAYLASDASAYHTGDSIVIDGGYLVNL